MQALDQLRENWDRLRRGAPGARFRAYHDDRAARRGGGWPLSRILTVVAGVLLIAGGLAIGWIPGPGGFIGIFGAALLATEWRGLARLLDWAELLVRRVWASARVWWRHSSATGKVLAVAGSIAAMASVVYLVGQILLR